MSIVSFFEMYSTLIDIIEKTLNSRGRGGEEHVKKEEIAGNLHISMYRGLTE